jgi:hypothetical protein
MKDHSKINKDINEVKDPDPVVIAIFEALSVGKALTFKDVAHAIADKRKKPKDGPNLWRRYLIAVKQQATHLAKLGRIEIIRNGVPVDPRNFKGIVTMRFPLK